MVDPNVMDLSPKSDGTDGSQSCKHCIKCCRGALIHTYFSDYSSNASLHGLRFIGEPNRTWFERIWWAIMFTICFVSCLILINQVWVKWEQTPMFVSFDEKPTPVWQVPFPAVTICSESKFKQDAYNFSDYYEKKKEGNLTESELKLLAEMSLLCNSQYYFKGYNHTDASFVDNLKEFCPSLDEMISLCLIQSANETKQCHTMFTPLLTEDGLCYTFNILDKHEFFRIENLHNEYDILGSSATTEGWTLDFGYPKNASVLTYPMRGMGYGVKAGMRLLLSTKKRNHDFACYGPILGFRIMLLNPAEIPRLSQEFFRVPISHEVVVAVSPDIMKTSEGLRNYEPKRRQCYFQDERYLQYFKVYTQQNCDYECLTNYTRNKCGCVHYAMPRDNSTPICSSGLDSCMYHAQLELLRMKIKAETEKGTHTEEKICDCLPACTSIRYAMQTSQVELDMTPYFKAFNFEDILNDTTCNTTSYGVVGLTITRCGTFIYQNFDLSSVVIFFTEGQFVTSRRTELYGQIDFLANCGGLLGLCLGFSALSLVEIIYYLTLRIWCNIYMRVNKTKSQLDNSEITDLQGGKNP